VTRTEAEVVAGFSSGAVRDEAAARARAAFRARFCSLEDGRAAERVVRRVWLGDTEAARRDPAAVAR
jgi:CDP-glycerol glycerophosphotransferase